MEFHGWVAGIHSSCWILTTVTQFSSLIVNGLKGMEFHGWVTGRHSRCWILTTVTQFSSPIGGGLKGMEFHGWVTGILSRCWILIGNCHTIKLDYADDCVDDEKYAHDGSWLRQLPQLCVIVQSIHYAGAELCDNCEDSALGVYANHPPEASITRMFFDNIDTKLTIYRAIPEAAGANWAAHETHFVVPNALNDSTVKRLINFDVAIDFDVAASLGERGSPPPRLGSDCFTSANTGQSHRDEYLRDARLPPKASQT